MLQDFISPVIITNLNVILYLSTCHTVYMCTNSLYDYTIINY